MTQPYLRLAKGHVNLLGIIAGLAVVSSILLNGGGYVLSIGANVAPTAGANTTSTGAAVQSSDPFAPCVPVATNAIACENSKPGNPPGEWDIVGSGDANIQGFATEISVNRGETVRFKVETNSNNYRLDIYRLGYYGGSGARLIATVQPSATLPQAQPPCLTQPSTGLVDCGNWAESASWTAPANATSGIYVAKLIREDGVSGASHIVFIVRDDSGASDLLFQTSDTTWQAYNSYGGNSLYVGSPAGRAYKVSYNRPFNLRGISPFGAAGLFGATYPMVRWIEANGYNVSYFSGVDTDRRGAEILEHRVFLSVGHDEYWSGPQRTNVEAARNAGIHLAFFSGNTMFWKTRWENSIDGSGTAHRTMVCYKETHANAKIDPLPDVWTGTWRDPRFSPPADGGRPENAVMGTIFTVNAPREDDMKVPEALGKFRFWRNTTVATQTPGQTATVGAGTVGYEWDEDLNNGFRPSGLIRLSSNTVNVGSEYLQDYGSTFGSGTATHSLTLYRHSSGSLVFSAATIRWSWGLDDHHDLIMASSNPPPDPSIRQATVNLLADMGVQPTTLQPGLTATGPSTDTLSPASTITSPTAGATVALGATVNITGIAADTGGLVAGVNVSVDGGLSWNLVTGTTSWNYSWTPTTLGSATIKAIAVDDSGNAQNTPTEINVTVIQPPPPTCPCSVWGSGAAPANPVANDGAAVELGLKFRSDSDGVITGVRFYKGGAANGGEHSGRLWTSNGTLLGSVAFASETASGWQQALFPTPIPITANTTYVISYFAPQGHYAADLNYFASSGVVNGPLRALSNSSAVGNGVYRYGPTGGFPTDTFQSSNYWVDVVFNTAPASDTTAPTVTSFSPAAGANNVNAASNVTVTFSEAMDAASVNGSTIELRDPTNTLAPATVSYNAASFTATLDPTASLEAGVTYIARVRGGSADPRVKDLAGNALAADVTWTFTTAAAPPPTCPCSIWGSGAAPTNPVVNDGAAVELGLKFRSDSDGVITGVRFYKGGPANGGTHVGHLWTSSGTLLGTVTFASETASGWQQALFPTPIPVTANTTYVVSYFAPQGNYAADRNYFASSGVVNGPLRALSNSSAVGNGVYRYSPTGEFPTDTFQSSNYWVDVVFTTAPAADTTAPTVTSFSPAAGANNVNAASNVTVTFSEAMDAASVNGSTIELRDPTNALATATVSYNAASFIATLDPTASLAAGVTYTARVRGGSADPRVKDLAGNALAADVTWTFTTAAESPATNYSIWAPTAMPTNPLENDGDAVELGLKFRSDIDGVITGVRFYKGGPANGGTHVGHLWTSSGTLLGTVTFASETASGWQQALFPTPIPITANTTYVISYFAPQGHYAADLNYFASSGVVNGPLRALSNSSAVGNGVYRYGPTGGFPTGTYQSTNYWLDMVFIAPGPP